MILRALLALIACLLALLPPGTLASIPRTAFVPPPAALFGVAFSNEQDCGPLTLHLDGLHDRAGPCGGVLVRQNPWSSFDPEGLAEVAAGTVTAGKAAAYARSRIAEEAAKREMAKALTKQVGKRAATTPTGLAVVGGSAVALAPGAAMGGVGYIFIGRMHNIAEYGNPYGPSGRQSVFFSGNPGFRGPPTFRNEALGIREATESPTGQSARNTSQGASNSGPTAAPVSEEKVEEDTPVPQPSTSGAGARGGRGRFNDPEEIFDQLVSISQAKATADKNEAEALRTGKEIPQEEKPATKIEKIDKSIKRVNIKLNSYRNQKVGDVLEDLD